MSRVPRKTGPPDATVTFTYESAYNQLVQPGSYVSLSQYFIAHWMPRISGPGLKILIQLRSMGYYNPKAGVQRGDIDIDQKDLAALCGLSLSTLKRAFQDDEMLTQYVQRVFEVRRDPRTGRILKEHYVYVVKMDDALIPADKQRLEEMLQGKDKPSGKPQEAPKGQNELSDINPMGQNDLSGVQSEPPIGQNELFTVQNEPPLKEFLNTFTTLNISDTPAAGQVCASLFAGEELPAAKPPVVQWQELAELEQMLWREQARAELVVIHAGTGITPKPKLIEVRAHNLYEASLSKKQKGE